MRIRKITGILLGGLLTFGLVTPAYGAIQYVTSTQANADGVSSISFNFTVPSGGSNNMLILANSSTRSVGVNTPTYGGVSMTSAYAYSNGFGDAVYFWYLANPTVGTNTIDFNTGGSSSGLGACAYVFSGVNQSNPINATSSFGSSGATSASLTITTTANNKYIVDGMTNTDLAVANVTASSTQTLRCDLGTGHGDGSGGEYSFRSSTRVATTTGAYTMKYDWSASDAEQVAYAAIALNEAAASSNRKIRGVGISR